jgi:SAM-dependent methyltransferase
VSTTGPPGLPTLVCPRCRRFADGALHVNTLASGGHLLLCSCGARYPRIDGVPVVFRDLDRWLESEGAEALRRSDLPPETAALVATGAGGALARNDALVATYARSRVGPLQDWLREALDRAEGPVLELGAGLGVGDRSDVVALDHNLALVRRHPGVRVCGDAADPPFLPASFATVVLPNLLDACPDPGLVLAQADALLRPGGRLVVTCAYAFQDAITPRPRRFTPDELVAALDDRGALAGYRIAHRLESQVDRLAWPLRVTDRLTHVHEVHALSSQKRG